MIDMTYHCSIGVKSRRLSPANIKWEGLEGGYIKGTPRIWK